LIDSVHASGFAGKIFKLAKSGEISSPVTHLIGKGALFPGGMK
jgi:hypothetical protein